MSQISSSTWSETANSNNAATPNGWPEGQAASTVNNCAREMMSALKIDWNERNPTVTSGGAANVQTLTYTTAPTAYVQGHAFTFIAGFTNTGTATLNVNAVGAKNIFIDNKALVGGEIVTGSVIQVYYDGTQFQIVSSRAPGSLIRGGVNILINPSLEVWARGAGGAASFALLASTGAYTADRWFANVGANEASVVSQTTPLTSQSRFALKFLRNNAQTGTAAMTLEQPFTTDQAVALRGQIWTLSFTAKCGANYSPTSSLISVTLYTGTGGEARRASGAFAGEATPISTTQALTTSAVRYSFTSTAVGASVLQASVLFSMTPVGTAGADDSFTIDDIQLEASPVAGAFDPLGYNFPYQLALCQRFFQKSFAYGTAPAQSAAGGGAAINYYLPTGASGTFGVSFRLPVTMRATTPTTTTYNPAAGNANWRDATNSADRVVTVVATTDGNLTIIGASGVAGSQNQIHWACDGDI